jgi:hypothetical protein
VVACWLPPDLLLVIHALQVALQFPEGLLMYACTIADILQEYAGGVVPGGTLPVRPGASTSLMLLRTANTGPLRAPYKSNHTAWWATTTTFRHGSSGTWSGVPHLQASAPPIVSYIWPDSAMQRH